MVPRRPRVAGAPGSVKYDRAGRAEERAEYPRQVLLRRGQDATAAVSCASVNGGYRAVPRWRAPRQPTGPRVGAEKNDVLNSLTKRCGACPRSNGSVTCDRRSGRGTDSWGRRKDNGVGIEVV
jgi:hypothetical protein